MREKPVRYKDVVYRSKLEAQWALFFDVLGIEYENESDNRVSFFLPGIKCYVGIKQNKPTRSEQLMALSLSDETGYPVHIFSGSIPNSGAGIECWGDCDFETFTFVAHKNNTEYSSPLYLGAIYALNECPECGKIDFAERGMVSRLPCHCTGNMSGDFSTKIRKAYFAARNHHFN
jgi:hypothetical protein